MPHLPRDAKVFTDLTFDTVVYKATAQAKFFGMWMDLKVCFTDTKNDSAMLTTETIRDLVLQLPMQCQQGARVSNIKPAPHRLPIFSNNVHCNWSYRIPLDQDQVQWYTVFRRTFGTHIFEKKGSPRCGMGSFFQQA